MGKWSEFLFTFFSASAFLTAFLHLLGTITQSSCSYCGLVEAVFVRVPQSQCVASLSFAFFKHVFDGTRSLATRNAINKSLFCVVSFFRVIS